MIVEEFFELEKFSTEIERCRGHYDHVPDRVWERLIEDVTYATPKVFSDESLYVLSDALSQWH